MTSPVRAPWWWVVGGCIAVRLDETSRRARGRGESASGLPGVSLRATVRRCLRLSRCGARDHRRGLACGSVAVRGGAGRPRRLSVPGVPAEDEYRSGHGWPRRGGGIRCNHTRRAGDEPRRSAGGRLASPLGPGALPTSRPTAGPRGRSPLSRSASLSLLAIAATVVAVAYVGFWSSGKRRVGLLAAALYAALAPPQRAACRPLAPGRTARGPSTSALHLYTEPLSTALVVTSVVLLLRPADRSGRARQPPASRSVSPP